MKRLLVAASLVFCTLAPPAARTEPAKQEAEFAPRKAYRECVNRKFALKLTRLRRAASPEEIADLALLDCRAEEMSLSAFAEEPMPVLKDRIKAFLVSGGHVPENVWR
jgi:hypothetical protein